MAARIGTAGDINCDGYNDVIGGTNGQEYEGVAVIFHGRATATP